jgi:hypothetical protein
MLIDLLHDGSRPQNGSNCSSPWEAWVRQDRLQEQRTQTLKDKGKAAKKEEGEFVSGALRVRLW